MIPKPPAEGGGGSAGRRVAAETRMRIMHIDLAGTRVLFKTGDARAVAWVRKRFGDFLVPEGPVDIEVLHAAPDAAVGTGPGTAVEEGSRKVTLYREVAHLDGALRLVLPAHASPDLIVHAALIADRERGYLCCGRPGAGKSTLARLLAGASLCDELARLHVGPNVVEGRALPFWVARNRRVPLAKIFFLGHGRTNRWSGLTVSDALRELRSHLYWPLSDPAAVSGVFASLAEVACRVPAYRLDFVPDRSVWTALTEAA